MLTVPPISQILMGSLYKIYNLFHLNKLIKIDGIFFSLSSLGAIPIITSHHTSRHTSYGLEHF
jgi:hypothetical protein